MATNNRNILSVRISGCVVNQPLHDADCSQRARELLAAGDIDGAVAEWRRIADLGSGNARCVLAYVYFRGAPSIAADSDEARRLARSALTSARGYANYVLGCIALKQHETPEAVTHFMESHKAGFIPAATLLAWMRFRSNAIKGERQKSAERLAKIAIGSGHLPARILLSRIYLSGQLGLAKRVYGLAMFPGALLRYMLTVRYNIFSVYCFHYIPTFKMTLFAESILAGR